MNDYDFGDEYFDDFDDSDYADSDYDYDDSMDGDAESAFTSMGWGLDESYDRYDEF